MRKIDYLIIGQGLAGSAIAWTLLRRGKSVMVIDEPSHNLASAVAAGMINPITGRIMTKTWLADDIFPFLHSFYSGAESATKSKFFHPTSLYRPFLSSEENHQWQLKIKSEEVTRFIRALHTFPAYEDQVLNPWGGIEIEHAGFINVVQWMKILRDELIRNDSYRNERYDDDNLVANESITYQDLSAHKIIFCNGTSVLDTKWFHWVPLKPLKGETLLIKTGLSRDRIFSRGVFVVPTDEEGIFTAGSTYVHPPFTDGPTQTGQEDISRKLKALIRPSFDIIHQGWGIRPTTPDRRPILGAHPANKKVLIFNGLGTKGVSLAPYFAHQLADWLEGNGDLMTEVNINRFKPLYSE